jgi:hypothetical protein
MPTPTSASADTGAAVRAITGAATGVKALCNSFITRAQASSVGANEWQSLMSQLVAQMNIMGNARATPGLDAAATTMITGYAGSLSGDAQTTSVAMQQAIDFINTNVPKDANGYALVMKWLPNGTQEWRTFSPAAAAPLVTLLQSIVATIA